LSASINKERIEAERWIRETGLPKLFNQPFRRQSVPLKSGGQYTFENVSDDGTIVAVISTTMGEAPDGKIAAQNLQKIRNNVMWALMIDQRPEKLLLVLTEQSMINLIKQEKKKDRFPKEIEIQKIKLPVEHAKKLIGISDTG
jgi:hypothetical protein